MREALWCGGYYMGGLKSSASSSLPHCGGGVTLCLKIVMEFADGIRFTYSQVCVPENR